MKALDVLVLSDGRLELRRIPKGLEVLQGIVGGYIEKPYVCDELCEYGIDIIINEEGKMIDGMKKEIVVIDKYTGEVSDIIFGNCIFAGFNEDGETIGLTKEQINKTIEILSNRAVLNDNSFVRVIYAQ